MDEALNFYCNILGLERAFNLLVTDEMVKSGNPWAQLGVGNPWIEYIRIPTGNFIELFYPLPGIAYSNVNGLDFTKNGFSHFSLLVDDIYEAAKIFESQGIAVWGEVSLGSDNTYQCWISDPDGNPIEIMQYTDKSLQLKESDPALQNAKIIQKNEVTNTSFNEKTTLKQISENEQAKAVLEKHMPGIWDNPGLKMAMNFNLKTLAGFPQSGIDQEKLQAIVADLSTIE
jgi:catechol 2,3-dioxygenase-like lactoylglutathione lyase family enzyme